MTDSPGSRFRRVVRERPPVQIPGVINAYCALLAERAGFEALYVSGAGVANASHGLPDLAMTTLGDLTEDVRRITSASDLPVLVDADTGFGGAFNIARTTRELIRAGAAAMHIEDQALTKRCGHRPNKAIVPAAEMCDRIKAAVDGRSDDDFVIMARTDAFAREGITGTVARAEAYLEAGADMIFAEALPALEDFEQACRAIRAPVLANMTEFGVTASLTRDQLATAGVSLILYPLSAFRAMSRAAADVYDAIIGQGTQVALLDSMQTRQELYDVLGYEAYEARLDALFLNDGDNQT